MDTDSLSRRTLLESAIRVAALPAGTVFFSAWMRAAQVHRHETRSSAPPDTSGLDSYHPQFFAPDDFRALQSFTEILIPTDETPGAREAHCAHFIDFLLHSMDGYAPETQHRWREAMAALRASGFHAAAKERQLTLVREIAQPERDPSAHHEAFAAYRLIKRENTFAFYTARAGCIEALDYRGNTYNIEFPACTHSEHQEI
jgi:hypothetical protein